MYAPGDVGVEERSEVIVPAAAAPAARTMGPSLKACTHAMPGGHRAASLL